MQIEGNKGLQSMFMVVYYVCSRKSTDRDYLKQCIELLIKFIFTKQIVVRTAAQIVLVKLCEQFDLIAPYESLYKSIKMTHKQTASKALKVSYAFEYRFNEINTEHLLHSMYICREIPRITKMNAHVLLSDEYYKSEMFDAEDAALAFKMDDKDIVTVPDDNVDVEVNYVDNNEETFMQPFNNNVQKKIVAYRETVLDRRIISSLPDDFVNKSMVSG